MDRVAHSLFIHLLINPHQEHEHNTKEKQLMQTFKMDEMRKI